MILEDTFAHHEVIALWFSGGKDSTALLHMCQPWRHRIIVIHNCLEADQAWPGMREHVERCCLEWGFSRVRFCEPHLSFESYVEQFGWPVEQVPSAYDGTLAIPSPYSEPGLKLSSWWHCTIMRLLQPLLVASALVGADAILTGQRGADAPLFARMGEVVNPDNLPWVRYNPLQSWSSEQVYAYLEMRNIALPAHYALWKRDADWEPADCRACTWQPQQWRILQAHYPDDYARWWPQAQQVYEVLRAETAKLSAALRAL